MSEQFNLRQSKQSPSVTFQLVSAYYVVAVEVFHIFIFNFRPKLEHRVQAQSEENPDIAMGSVSYGKSTDCPFAEPMNYDCATVHAIVVLMDFQFHQ